MLRDLRTMNTKKLPNAIHAVKTKASKAKMPAFIPFAMAESDLPKQAAQAKALGLPTTHPTTTAIRVIQRRFMVKDS